MCVRLCSFLFQLDRFIPISKLKYYFAVDTVYVGKKLGLLVFPYMHEVSSLLPVKPKSVQVVFFVNWEVLSAWFSWTLMFAATHATECPWGCFTYRGCLEKVIILITIRYTLLIVFFVELGAELPTGHACGSTVWRECSWPLHSCHELHHIHPGGRTGSRHAEQVHTSWWWKSKTGSSNL